MARIGWKILVLILAFVMAAGCVSNKKSKPKAGPGEVIIDAKEYDGDTLKKQSMALDGYLEELVDNFLVIYDATGSKYVPYNGVIKLRIARETISRFNDKTPERPLVGGLRRLGYEAGAFTEKTEILYGMTDYSRPAFKSGIDSIKWAGGKTPMRIAINAASQDMTNTVGYMALVIFSDGKYPDGDPMLAEIIMELENNPKLVRKFRQMERSPILGDLIMEMQNAPNLSKRIIRMARRILNKHNDPDAIKAALIEDTSLAERFREIDRNPVIASKVLAAAAKAVTASSVQAALNMKKVYGDRLCIYTVQIGDLPFGKLVLEKVAEAGGCGYFVTADQLIPDKNMTDFADDVFTRRHRFEQPDKQPRAADLGEREKCPGTPRGAKVDEDGCWVIEKVQFDLNKWNIKPQYNRVIEDMARVLKMNPELKIEVHGHTCNIWTERYNMKLSHWRALSVTSYLLKMGVPSSQIAVKGYGYTRPFASNRTERGRVLNRRAEFHPIR